MKHRFGNILVAATYALIVFVWIPTFAVGALGMDALDGWTEALKTAYWHIGPERFSHGFNEQGLMIWGGITALILAAKYFITGSVLPRFR